MKNILIYNNPAEIVHFVKDLTVDEIKKYAEAELPKDTQYIITTVDKLPYNRIFRNAWRINKNKNSIQVNLKEAKQIAHKSRRLSREEKFAPFDDIIAKQVPGEDFASAEKEREKIRAKYKILQSEIDDCNNVKELNAKCGWINKLSR